MERMDKRAADQLRPVRIEMGFQKNAMGSCLISFGNTRVICSASVENNVPPFLTGMKRILPPEGPVPGL